MDISRLTSTTKPLLTGSTLQATCWIQVWRRLRQNRDESAACRIFGIKLKGFVDPMRPSAVYSMPEVAGVGLTEEQCRSQGLDYAVGRSDLSLIPRGAIAGHGGILKLIFSKKDRRVLGYIVSET